MRIHPRKEAGIVVDFTPKAATHSERVVSLHSLLDADFYREGARVTPAPRRRVQRRARRKLTPASWLVPVTPDVLRRKMVIAREWQRVDPKFLDDDEQEFWGEIAGRQLRFEDRTGVRREADPARRVEAGDGEVPVDRGGAEPEPAAAADRAGRPRLDARRARRLRRPRHPRLAGAAVGEGSPGRRPHDAAGDRRVEARRARIRSWPAGRGSSPARCGSNSTARRRRSSPTRSGSSARSRTRAATATRRTRRSSSTRRSRCRRKSRAALLASAEGYTPRATQLLEAARERLGSIQEVAGWIADNLPQPKTGPARTRRRRRRKRRGPETQGANGAPARTATVTRAATARPTAPPCRSRPPSRQQTRRAPPERRLHRAPEATPPAHPSAAPPGARGARNRQWRRRRRTPQRSRPAKPPRAAAAGSARAHRRRRLDTADC